MQILDLDEDFVDLTENALGLAGREKSAMLSREQPNAQQLLRVLHHPTDAGCGHPELICRTSDGPRQHDGANDLDLTQRQHVCPTKIELTTKINIMAPETS